MNKISKLARASATVAKEARTAAAKARAEKRVNLERIIRDGDPDSKAVKKAKKQLREMDVKEAAENNARRARASGSKNVDLPPLKSEMAYGGSVNGKKHMYAAGGSVMDNLTSAQKNMVKKMAAANKK